MVHCGVIRQSAEIVDIHGREALRTGERAVVKFRYIHVYMYMYVYHTKYYEVYGNVYF